MTFSLLTVGLSLSIFFTYYLKQERIDLLDNQLRENALILVNSELETIAKIDFEEAEKLINNELGTNRIGKVFIIRNNKNQIIFKSKSAKLLKADFPQAPQKFTIKIDSKTYRVLNLQLPKKPDRTLQVAVLLDTEDFEWSFIFKKLLVYILICTSPIILISFFLTRYLLSPVRLLSLHLEQVGAELKSMGEISLLPKYFDRFTDDSFINNDEFSVLLKTISSLLERINLNYKITKPWSYQLAHEIKTPLAILNFDIDAAKEKEANIEEISQSMKSQVSRISNTVNDFLAWATMSNSLAENNLFGVKVINTIEFLIDSFEKIYPGRIHLVKTDGFSIISNPNHLMQVLNNIIENALKYSDNRVEISIQDSKIIVRDYGLGIPAPVLERIGQPFNFGNEKNLKKGTGLGLAWVITLSKFYNWTIDFQVTDNGTLITIDFSKSHYQV